MSLKKFMRAAVLAVAAAASLAPSVSALAQTAAASGPAPAQAPALAESSAPTPAATEAPALAPAAASEAVDNPYGLGALWAQGDLVAKGTLIIMVIMSIGSWYIIFIKLFEQQKLLNAANAAGKSFWTAGSVRAGADTLRTGSAFRYIAEQGVTASEHHEGTLVEQIDLHTWVTMSIQRAVDKVNSRLQDGLAFLATVGSTAPFVGLFGTVWGIYHALTAIGISGQASIDKVAGPVGEALIMTAIGLAVAVPAVMGYNWLIRRNKNAMERVRSFSGDLHNVLIAGKR
ncbi:MotA/TolQ/ExbB proton channel family protein [Variovorax sp. E3]|uniref:MotA/TolQ/ExbB proton channel family protein n=1 Tax=Variovorax sp. E3 TaxID=1914993 RepID=UPI0018DDA4EF|nr:MotA/TolQ/ExbB proton channel family protein [Variovorax sp. E3]